MKVWSHVRWTDTGRERPIGHQRTTLEVNGSRHCSLHLSTGGGGGLAQGPASDCLPLAAPIGLSPLLILTLRWPEHLLVVSTEPLDDLSCFDYSTVGRPGEGLLPVLFTRCIHMHTHRVHAGFADSNFAQGQFSQGIISPGENFATLEISKAPSAVPPNDCNKTTRHAPDQRVQNCNTSPQHGPRIVFSNRSQARLRMRLGQPFLVRLHICSSLFFWVGCVNAPTNACPQCHRPTQCCLLCSQKTAQHVN